MKLLHPEVDIEPGRHGSRPHSSPVSDHEPLPGSAVVRLTNSTPQENAYTLRLHCDQPYWQDAWYSVTALPPAPGAENAPPSGKPDQRGHEDRWVKIYVPRGGTRDILIRFHVPDRPEARAGSYDYEIEVETQVTGPERAARRADRVRRLPARAIVRPYYRWSLDVTPNTQRVGRRRRAGDFEVVVTNEGNDWLYCDLQLPRPKDLLLDTPTVRMAVPPPLPGEMLRGEDGREERPGTRRSVPVRALTQLRNWRGEPQPQPLDIAATRLDAPSVPPHNDEQGYTGMGAVVASATSDAQQVPGERQLLYMPPIPSRIAGIFTQSGSGIRSLVYTALGVLLFWQAFGYMWQLRLHQGMELVVNTSSVEAGGSVTMEGRQLEGARVQVGNKKDGYEDVGYKLVLNRLPRSIYKVTIPKRFDGQTVRVRAQRGGIILPFLSNTLPYKESNTDIQVGHPATPPVVASVSIVEAGPYKPGATFDVYGQHLGDKGDVLVDDLKATVKWSDDKASGRVPAKARPGAKLAVTLKPEGSEKPLPAGSIQVEEAVATATPPRPHESPRKPSSDPVSGRGAPTGPAAAPNPPARRIDAGSGKPQPPDGNTPTVPVPNSPGEPPRPVPTIAAAYSGQVQPGQQVSLAGSAFGSRKGMILIGERRVAPERWTPSQVVFSVPKGLPEGTTLPIALEMPDKQHQRISAGEMLVEHPVPVPSDRTNFSTTSGGNNNSTLDHNPRTATFYAGLVQPGQTLTLPGPGLGKGRGKLFIGTQAVASAQWSDAQATFRLPGKLAVGALPLTLEMPDRQHQRISAGTALVLPRDAAVDTSYNESTPSSSDSKQARLYFNQSAQALRLAERSATDHLNGGAEIQLRIAADRCKSVLELAHSWTDSADAHLRLARIAAQRAEVNGSVSDKPEQMLQTARAECWQAILAARTANNPTANLTLRETYGVLTQIYDRQGNTRSADQYRNGPPADAR